MTEKISVNSVPALVAMKFWLLRERQRHFDDIWQIDKDLDKLKEIRVPDSLDINAWYEIDV